MIDEALQARVDLMVAEIWAGADMTRVLAADAAARLSGRRTFEKCPRCGQGYKAGVGIHGTGHTNSDYCLVCVVHLVIRQLGLADLRRDRRHLLDHADIGYVYAKGGYCTTWDSSRPKFRSVTAEDRMYVIPWIAFCVEKTEGGLGINRVRLLRLLVTRDYSYLQRWVTSPWFRRVLTRVKERRDEIDPVSLIRRFKLDDLDEKRRQG